MLFPAVIIFPLAYTDRLFWESAVGPVLASQATYKLNMNEYDNNSDTKPNNNDRKVLVGIRNVFVISGKRHTRGGGPSEDFLLIIQDKRFR